MKLRLAIFLAELFNHDKATFEHCVRVAKYLRSLSGFCDLDQTDTDNLVRAGLLHDIGKLAVSRQILTKPEELDEAEKEEIKDHPKIGQVIALLTKQNLIVADLILTHHEPGYPRNEIRFPEPRYQLKQLLRLADKFDALRSQRAYKPEFGFSECKAVLLTSGFEERLIDQLIEVNRGLT